MNTQGCTEQIWVWELTFVLSLAVYQGFYITIATGYVHVKKYNFMQCLTFIKHFFQALKESLFLS